MYTNTGMYSGYEVETNKETKTTTNTSYATGTTTSAMPGMVMAPIYECPQERVIHREIMHEVPQGYPFMSYKLMINKYKLKSYYEIIFTFIITLFILIFHP